MFHKTSKLFKTLGLMVVVSALAGCVELDLKKLTSTSSEPKQYGDTRGQAKPKTIDTSMYMTPTDVIVDKRAVMGTVKEVAGSMLCSGDYCQFYDPGTTMGNYIIANIDQLPRDGRKYALANCKVMVDRDTCQIVLGGEVVERLASITVMATSLKVLK